MTRKYYRGSFDYLPAVLYIVLSIPLWPANSHHWDSNLFVLLSVILFLTWWDKGGLLNLSLSGLTAGIATCFMQHKGLLIFVIFAALILVETIHKKQKVINLITKVINALCVTQAKHGTQDDTYYVFFHICPLLLSKIIYSLLFSQYRF